MAHLLIERAGLFSTVQDLGRPGFLRYGVPVGGALDADALAIANALVGNPAGAAALEFRFVGARLRVEADAATVALSGASTSFTIDGASKIAAPPYRAMRVRRGEVIDVASLRDSATVYLAVAGGIAVAPVLGSRSTLISGGFGGLDGRKLVEGDALPLGPDVARERPLRALHGTPLKRPEMLRVVLGPQHDMFAASAIETFLASSYKVSHEADRMGIRFDGAELAHRAGYNIVSDGIAPGAIQVPGSRQPILLLADRQTTGGYPKIATVISADIAGCGRLRPGDGVRFVAVTVEEAEDLARRRAAFMRELVGDIERQGGAGLDLEALYSQNLISGVVDRIGE